MTPSIRNAAKTLTAALALAGLAVGTAGVAHADCFGFRDKEAVVCVDGGDNAARRTATSVCEDVTGSSCRISGTVGDTCQEGSRRQCYDASGNRHRRISVD